MQLSIYFPIFTAVYGYKYKKNMTCLFLEGLYQYITMTQLLLATRISLLDFREAKLASVCTECLALNVIACRLELFIIRVQLKPKLSNTYVVFPRSGSIASLDCARPAPRNHYIFWAFKMNPTPNFSYNKATILNC